MDRDVKALKVYCPNKKDGCDWIGEIARVDDHVKECEISCSKCKQIVYFSTMRSHLDTECPCYCPYCDITAEREVISSEHKEKCCEFPITCPNNIGVDNGPHDKFDKINESQNEIFSKILNSSILVELQKDIATIRNEVVRSTEIAKEHSVKVDKQINETRKQNVDEKQNDTTLINQLCNIRSLTIAVLIIAILIALFLQSPHGMSEDQMVERLDSLQANILVIKTELHDISLSVSKLQTIQHNNSLFTEQIEEAIRGIDYRLYETNKQLYSLQAIIRLWQPITTELNQSVSKLQTMQQNSSLWNKQIEEIISGMNGKLNETREDLNSIKVKLEDNTYRHTQNITKLHQQITITQAVLNETVENQLNNYHQLSSSIWSIKLLLSSDNMYNQVAPVIVKMSSFTKKLIDKEEWHSNPFLAFGGGYQMCLQVYAAGNDDGEGTHVSVYLRLMKGPHDDKLEQSGHWPLRGTFTIELLNQLNDSDHYSRIVQFHHHQCSECTDRVVSLTDYAARGWGKPQFISHNALFHHSNDYRSDSLIFRISYEDVGPPYQIAPVSFKVRHFSQHLKCKQKWHSSSFFAFSDGYLMSLIVSAAGNGDGKGTHVSVLLYLMKGPHDDKLEQSGHWPLRGTFTIELLNQLNDSDHYSRMLQFHHHRCSKCTKRVFKGVKADGWGKSQFISHDALLYNNDYYRIDSLIFRISYEHMELPYQITPVTFKVSKFSQWVKSKDIWLSSPFFAFKKGYQMYLRVDAAGYAQGESTHVSVYLYLMKGPHNDKLERSGHWPLRGIFTIELLNQFNNSDHYSDVVQFHYRMDGIFTGGWGNSKFISHDTLFHHTNNSYYRSDLLIFRISYKDVET